MALKLRRGTNAGRTAITPAEGEPIFTTDTKQLYIGDGTTAGGVVVGGGGLTDGDKGDVTVSSSGATWRKAVAASVTCSPTESGRLSPGSLARRGRSRNSSPSIWRQAAPPNSGRCPRWTTGGMAWHPRSSQG